MASTPPESRPGQRRSGWKARLVRLPALAAAIVATLWVTGCMERLFYHPDAGPTPLPSGLPTGFPNAVAMDFPSKDGTRLHGWFIPAQVVASGERAPTVIHVHGNAGNIASHIGFTDFLPQAGFNLFIFDYRGYGQSEGKATRRGPLIEDAEAALEAMLKRPEVDPERVGMFAQSLGGAIGLNVMAQRREIRCAVVESAFSSWRDEAADAVGGGKPGWISKLMAAILIGDSRRPDEAIALVKRPVLLLHGSADGTIPAHHSQRLAAASGGWATLIEYPGGDHNTLHETHPQSVMAIVDFFREHLEKGSNGPAAPMP